MIAAKHRVAQLQALQQTPDLDKQLLLAQRLIIGERLAKPRLALGKTDYQGREELRLRSIHQTRRVIGMLPAQITKASPPARNTRRTISRSPTRRISSSNSRSLRALIFFCSWV